MNGADNNLTPSDLIYLFVDGEASDLERTMLFNALVGDSELQAELADAIRINSAAQGEMFETLPPAAVTRALFRRVESLSDTPSIAPTVAGAAGAAAAGSGLATDRPPVVSTAESGHRRRLYPFIAPLVTGALGLLLGFVLFNGEESMNGNLKEERLVAAADELRGDRINTDETHGRTTEANAEGNPSDRDLSRLGPTGEERRSEVMGGARSNTDRETEWDNLSTINVEAASGQMRRTSPQSDVVTVDGSPSLPSLTTSRESSEELNSLFTLEDLAVTNPRTPLLPNQVRLDLEEPLAEAFIRPTTTDDPEEEERFSFFVRGGTRGDIYPERIDMKGTAMGENLENLAIGGYWNLNETHAVGLQGGRDFHPFYREARGEVSALVDVGTVGPRAEQPVILSHVGGGGVGGNPVIGFGDPGDGLESTNTKNSTGGRLLTPLTTPPSTTEESPTEQELRLSTVDPTIEWIGLGYRLRGPGIDQLGRFRPEMQAAVGFSAVGPVGRTLLGLSWQPGTHVSLTAGVEGTGVMYRRDGETFTSRKVGVVYGVEVGF